MITFDQILIPDNVKHANSLFAFKNALEKLNIYKCPCKLCRDYILGVGYINKGLA